MTAGRQPLLAPAKARRRLFCTMTEFCSCSGPTRPNDNSASQPVVRNRRGASPSVCFGLRTAVQRRPPADPLALNSSVASE